MRKFLLIVILAVLLVFLSGCTQGEKRIMSAKVRYFDGSMDTILIDRYRIMDGTVTIYTDSGRKIVIGANNVIIIEESEAQYNCKE